MKVMKVKIKKKLRKFQPNLVYFLKKIEEVKN